MSNENKQKKQFLPAPEDTYKMRLARAVVKETKAGTGKYLDCMFEFTKEELTKEHGAVFEKYNFDNPNPKAVKISRILLGHYLIAVGLSDSDKEEVLNDVTKIEDTIGDPFMAELKIKDEGKWGLKNRIAKYMAR